MTSPMSLLGANLPLSIRPPASAPILFLRHCPTPPGIWLNPTRSRAVPSSIFFNSSAGIRLCSFAKLKQACWFSFWLQKVSQDSFELQPPGPLPPVFLTISASSLLMNPAFSAKLTHSVERLESEQYV